MKQLLFFVLLPFSLFAQTFYPDTISMKYGKTFPCLVTGINDYSVNIIYENLRQETAVLEGIKTLSLGGIGTIYKEDTGFKIKKDSLSLYFSNRNTELKSKKNQLKKEEVLEIVNGLNMQNEGVEKVDLIEMNSADVNIDDINLWGFGVLYVPFYSGDMYYLVENYGTTPYLSKSQNNEINMESQLSYKLNKQFLLTCNIGYTSASSEVKSESHTRNDNQNPPYVYDSGNRSTYGIKLLNLSIGIKYQFTDIVEDKVSAFILAGFGKQIAYVKDEDEILFNPNPNPNPTVIHQNNNIEFLENINSPWQFNLGFGGEYFFNNSLSMFSNIRFLYSSIEAKYESRTISPGQSESYSREYKLSDIITRVGLGVNFYF